MDLTLTQHDLKERIAGELDTGRRSTLGLVDPFTDEELTRAPSKLMSPLVWDLAHIANYEELWLLREVAGHPPTDPAYDDLYNAFEHPRWERPSLPLLGPRESRAYLDEVRGRTLDVLEGVELDPAVRILDRGYVYGMVVQHEHMHDETMLATIQLMKDRAYEHGTPPAPSGGPVGEEMVFVAGGPFPMGTDDEPWSFDNEHGAHTMDVAPFWIDTTPVTNGAYLAFMSDGGYDDPRHWTPDGWAYRQKAGLEAPLFWTRRGSTWTVRRFGRDIGVTLDEPVQHVCFHEAEAFARWAGKRLPTEAEWEKAASWTGDRKRRYTWGDLDLDPPPANLGRRHMGPAPVGAYPDGASAYGVHQMLGDVWEWTSSDFSPYPGYEWFPYREYSEVFFGTEYKVLRGGSWATHPMAARNTFRNWDYPIRRQIFCGFRCSKDAS